MDLCPGRHEHLSLVLQVLVMTSALLLEHSLTGFFVAQRTECSWQVFLKFCVQRSCKSRKIWENLSKEATQSEG